MSPLLQFWMATVQRTYAEGEGEIIRRLLRFQLKILDGDASEL